MRLFCSLVQCLPPTCRPCNQRERETQALPPGILGLQRETDPRAGWRSLRVAGACPGRRAKGPGQRGVGAGRRTLTSGCLRRMCLLMEALVDTLVPHSWQLCASTLSWVSCTCFCSMYSVTYFLSHTEHVHCLPTSHRHAHTRGGKDKRRL